MDMNWTWVLGIDSYSDVCACVYQCIESLAQMCNSTNGDVFNVASFKLNVSRLV